MPPLGASALARALFRVAAPGRGGGLWANPPHRCLASPASKLEVRSTMRAVRVHQVGGPEQLVVEEGIPTPDPGEGELLVKNAFSGLNFHDTYTRSGLYQKDLPFIVGCEGGGHVVAVGKGIPASRIGQRVAYFSDGSYAEYTAVPSHRAAIVPPDVQLQEAVGLFVQGLTAHYLARTVYPVKSGTTCLIHAGAGGTGGLLIQLAKQLGATVIATASTIKKAEMAREHGADHALVYREPAEGGALRLVPWLTDEVRRLTPGGGGCDVVFDSVGRDTALSSMTCLKRRGMLVLYGNASGPPPPIDPLMLSQLGSLTLCRPKLHDYMFDEAETRWRGGEILGGIFPLKLTLQFTFSLADVQQAHKLIEDGLTHGKILFRI